MSAAPSADELIAIAAALAAAAATEMPAAPASSTSAWTLAMRLPDLELEDLLALRRAADGAVCSTRF